MDGGILSSFNQDQREIHALETEVQGASPFERSEYAFPDRRRTVWLALSLAQRAPISCLRSFHSMT